MNRFLQLDTNKVGKDFVIGDIHGRYDALMYGLDQVSFDWDNDRLFAVGDLIDRGTQNMQVLDLIGNTWFYTILGNHEVMMANALIDGGTILPYAKSQMQFWISNGGAWYYDLDADDLWLIKNHYVPLIANDLPIAIEFIAENGMRIGITHAGLPLKWTWDQLRFYMQDVRRLEDKEVQECIWTRTKIQDNRFRPDLLGIDLLINGHTPSIEEVWRGNNVFIDLGACNEGQLTPINVMDLLNRKNKNEHYAWKN